MQSSIEKHFENIIKSNENMDDLLSAWNSKENKKSLAKILKKFSLFKSFISNQIVELP